MKKISKFLFIATASVAMTSCSIGNLFDFFKNSEEVPSTPGGGTIDRSEKSFKDALNADYSNCTVAYQQVYANESQTEVAYEYYVNGYTVVDDYTSAEMGYTGYYRYSVYHDYDGVNYVFWPKEHGYEYDGWLNKGYRDSDLSIWHAYFSIDYLLKNITEDDVEYFLGAYFVKTSSLARLNNTAFSFYGDPFMGGEDLTAISFTIGEDGHFKKIIGSVSDNSDDGIEIQFGYFGTTSSPITLPEAPNPSNIHTYKEMLGDDYVEDVYITDLELNVIPGQDIKKEDGYDAVIKIDDSIEVGFTYLPENANQTYVRWSISDEDVCSVEFRSNWTSHHKYLSGLSVGEATIYCYVTGASGQTIKSNSLKVKVVGEEPINKENAVYDLTITGISDRFDDNTGDYLGTDVYANNSVQTNALHTITAHNVKCYEARNTDSFGPDGFVLVSDPSSQDYMQRGLACLSDVLFDFGDQQVISFEFMYALHKANQKGAVLKTLSEAYIETSNDGVTWSDKIDLKEEMLAEFEKINGDYGSNLKHLTREFDLPVSKIKLTYKAYSIGSNFNICMNEFVAKTNEDCHNHENVVEVPVSSLTIACSENSVKVNKTISFSIANILPSDATNKALKWHSTDSSILSIDENTGLATGVAEGSVEVYAVASNGVESNHITIQVTGKEFLPNNLLGTYYLKSKDGYYYSGNWYEITLKIVDTTSATLEIKPDGEELYSVTLDYDTVDSSVYYFEAVTGETLSIQKGNEDYEVFFNSDKLSLGNKYTNYGEIFVKYVGATKISVRANSKEIESLDMIVGDEVTTYASVLPNEAYYKSVSAVSRDASIVKVVSSESSIVLTALSAGKTNVVYKNADGIEKVIPVTVTEVIKSSEITINATSTSIDIGETITLSATLSPDGVNTSNLVWSIDNEDVAILSINSVTKVVSLKGVSAGQVTVTCLDTVSNVSGNLVIEVNSAVALFESKFVGTFTGFDENSQDISFTFNADGTGYMSFAGDNYELEFVKSDSSSATFALVANSAVTFTISDSGDSYSIDIDDSGMVLYFNYDIGCYGSGTWYDFVKE